MSKKRIIPIFLCFVFVLSSCSKDDEIEIRNIPVSDLQSDMNKAISKDYEQFIISDSCYINAPESISDCTFTSKSDFADKYREVFKNLAGINECKDKYLSKDNDENMGQYYIYDDESNRQYAAITNSGFSSFYTNEMYDSLKYDSTINDVVTLGTDEWKNKKISINNKEITAEQVAVFGEKWLNEKWKQYEPNFDFEVIQVISFVNNENNMINLRAIKTYKGVRLCYSDDIVLPPDETEIFYTATRNSEISLSLSDSDKVSGFSTGYSTFDKAILKEDRKDIISAQSAMKIAEEKFSGFNELEVVSVSLKYLVLSEVYYSPILNDDGSLTNNVSDVKQNFTTKAVWELLIKPDMTLGENRSSYPEFLYINIDVDNGDVTYMLDPVRQRGV